MKTSVIFPVRNEEKLIKTALLDVYNHIKRKGYTFEILAVANGCVDKTEQIISELSKKFKQVKLLKSQPGYGYAIRKGLEKAEGDYVVIFNVDFYDLHIIDLIDIDLYGRDFIIGSKMAHWSLDRRAFSRRAVSLLFNMYLNIFHNFKGSDTHGIKVIKKDVIKKIYKKCVTTSGIFDTEFVIKAQKAGYSFADFPVTVEEKRAPRFSNRLIQTPIDIMDLYKSLK